MKMKKTFACLLAVLLICGIMPTGVFADETSDGETTDEPRYKVAIQLTDSETDFTDSNPYYSLEGSVYDIYKDVADPDNYSYWEQEPYATTQATDANGYCEVPWWIAGRKLCCDYAHKSNGVSLRSESLRFWNHG